MKSIGIPPSTPSPSFACPPPHQQLPAICSSLPSPPPSTERGSTRGPSAPVLQALDLFRAHRKGCAASDRWARLTLDPVEFDELLECVAQDQDLKGYVEDKIRYDYIPQYSELIIRMPAYVHELLSAKIVAEFQRQIDGAATKHPPNTPLGRLIRLIEYAGSTNVVEQPNDGEKPSRHWRSPDASFRCLGSLYPGVIIETSYSQRVKNLRRVADDYVMMSDGNVKMVLGLDIGYVAKKGEEPVDKVFVWEAALKMEEVPVLVSECTVDKIFRGPNGQTLETSNDVLSIPLRSFAPRCLLDHHGVPESQHQQTIVSIPISTLASFLSTAQSEYESCKVASYKDGLPSGGIKRPLSMSSEDELAEEDERKWKRREEVARERTERDDGDWE